MTNRRRKGMKLHTVWLDEELTRDFRKRIREKGKTMSDVMRKLIDRWARE